MPAPPGPPPAQPCPACGSGSHRVLFGATDRLYHTTNKEFLVVECSSCRLLRLSPWPTPAEMRLYYPREYWFAAEQDAGSRLAESYRRLVLGDHIRFVMRALRTSGETGPVLDVGCGGGLFLRMLADRGRPGMGLDFSIGAASTAWRYNGVPAVCAQLSNPPFRPESCAAVTMFHVLEHLYDPAVYLDAARELLAPNGRLIVQVPNAACWQFLLLGENWNGVDVPRHLINFRLRDLEALLDHCGFEVVRVKHFSLRDNPAGLASSIAPGLDPMARRIRRVPETPVMRVLKDFVYFGLTVAALPFTAVEAACRAGSTVMIEAKKRQ